MKNKHLVKMLALVVFINFTIPSYVIDAAAQNNSKAFSRNLAPRELLKEAQQEPQRIPDSFFEEEKEKQSSFSSFEIKR